MTDKDIQVLEEMQDKLFADNWHPWTRPITPEAQAIANLLSDFRDMREMVEAAAEIVIVDGNLPDGGTRPHHIFNIGTGWIVGNGPKEHDSALDAWREVKGRTEK